MAAQLDQDIEAVRQFSRFYTKRIGVLHEGLLGSRFSLAEARLIWELANRGRATASVLADDLALDPGYLSRLVKRLEGDGLVHRTVDPGDARQQHLGLTADGLAAFAQLNDASRFEIGQMLRLVAAPERRHLVEAMATISAVLGQVPDHQRRVLLRQLVPGDIGWVIHRQTKLYHQEFGWTKGFEALVCHVGAEYLDTAKPGRDDAWIAEVDGEIAGSVFVVEVDQTTAKLRMLYVEQSARGLGLGGRLVDTAVGFARRAGYARVILWTNDVLDAARRIYERAGFQLIACEPNHDFGPPMQAQTWALDLGDPALSVGRSG